MAARVENPEYEAFLETVANLVLKQEGLCRSVLESLEGGPKRWSDLKPLLEGRGDESLNMCLRFLAEESLVERSTDARQHPVVHEYRISPLGREALRFIAERAQTPDSYALVTPSGRVYRLFRRTIRTKQGKRATILVLSSRPHPEGEPVKRLTTPLRVDPARLESGDPEIQASA